ncbi:MAG: hypothetical protein DI537_20330 [Stutzerimonas stutzeri]|nr:MAG: hypothetical protein DI537_20330 [Stutzerimonas stutzeri]
MSNDYLQQKIVRRFGGTDATGLEQYLVDAGYVLGTDKSWTPRDGVVDYQGMIPDERNAMFFLALEHGYGGLSGVPLPFTKDEGDAAGE